MVVVVAVCTQSGYSHPQADIQQMWEEPRALDWLQRGDKVGIPVSAAAAAGAAAAVVVVVVVVVVDKRKTLVVG